MAAGSCSATQTAPISWMTPYAAGDDELDALAVGETWRADGDGGIAITRVR